MKNRKALGVRWFVSSGYLLFASIHCKKEENKAEYTTMKNKRKRRMQIEIIFLCIIWFPYIVWFPYKAVAAGSIKIVETYTGESSVALYVKGTSVQNLDEVEVQIGTTAYGRVDKQTIAEGKQPVHTLIMLDNSLSIPKKSRKRIAGILQNLIADRTENEKVAVAVLNKEIEYLTDYTSDYTQLKSAVDTITYRNTETYLTDVLYEWLSEYRSMQEDIFYRVLVIADGTDNKPIGYTQNELFILLKEVPVPIYTIGVRTKENNEELENMFAISRACHADSFLLDEMDHLLAVNDALNADREILKLVLRPDAEQLDGKKKAVKLRFASEEVFTTEVYMPQAVQEKKPVETQSEALKQPKEEKSQKKGGWLIVILIGLVAAAAAAVGILLLIRKKRSKNRNIQGNASAPVSDPMFDRYVSPDAMESGSQTQMVLPVRQQTEEQNQTVIFWEQETVYHIVFEEVGAPFRLYELPVKKEAVIGRKKDGCDLALVHDPTVSARHCKIAVHDAKFYITDLKSSNGTYINGRKIFTETEIQPGSRVSLGKLELKFDVK